MSWLSGVFLVAFCLWRTGAQTQNLNNVDVKEPVVRVSPDQARSNNDYFGWSAIFHPIEALDQSDTMADALRKIKVIIGAPLGTYPGGLPLPDPFRPRADATGLIYNCPIAPGNCEGVRGDFSSYIDNPVTGDSDFNVTLEDLAVFIVPSGYVEGRLFDQSPSIVSFIDGLVNFDRPYENKTGQLLGSFLYSNGEYFMACAPLWTVDITIDINSERRQARGACFSSGRDLQGFVPLTPCDNGNAGSNNNNNQQGFCLSGTSALVNDGNYVVGVPGFSIAQGALSSSPISTPAGTRVSFTIGDSTPYLSNGNPDSSALRDQYQGYQIANAYILTSDRSGPPNLITTVPRAGLELHGRVQLYPSPSELSSTILTNATGTQIGEFFGYSMIAQDLNNDMYDDVVVGAPMYTDYNDMGIEIGRVYVFMNDRGELSGNPIIIEGSVAFARLGSSLAALGDIDRDGYTDFAIGSPYSGSGENTGTVHIYYGRSNPTDIPMQTPYVISAETIAGNFDLAVNGLSSLKTFGWSLSSGYDVDMNGYNDLLVGAYESQSVFVLRTLPVADVTVTFVQHPIVDIDNNPTFNLQIMASYDGTGVADSLNVDFEVFEMTRRISFQPLDSMAPGTGTFVLSGKNMTTSTNVTVYTKQDISNFDQYVIGIRLLAIPRTVNGQVTGNETITDLSPFPVIRHGGQTSTEIQVQNFCGADGCISDVFFRSVSPMDLTVIANGETSSQINVVVENGGAEPALDMRLIIRMIPEYITAISAVDSMFTCEPLVNGTLNCDFSQERLDPNEVINTNIQLVFNQTLLVGDEPDELFDLQLVIPTDNNNVDNNEDNNQQTIGVSIVGQADISVSIDFSPSEDNYREGTPDPDQVMTSGASALGDEVNLVAIIGNSGPTTIQNATLTVYLPSSHSEITTGERTFLYPSIITTGRQITTMFTCNESSLNPSGLGTSAVTVGRKKRLATDLSVKRTRRELSMSSSYKFNVGFPSLVRNTRQADDDIAYDLDCTPDSPSRNNCTVITCGIQVLRKDNVSISFHTRIDGRFFGTLEDRPVFNLRAYATVQIDNDYITENVDQTADNNNDASLVLNPPMMPVVDAPDLLHAILWPVLAGIIILIVIIIILYFCGFFRRKRKPDGEIEGDFDVDQYATSGPAAATNKKAMDEKEEITGL